MRSLLCFVALLVATGCTDSIPLENHVSGWPSTLVLHPNESREAHAHGRLPSARSRNGADGFPFRFQDLGRQPYTARKWLIQYQDRVLFGTDGNPGREIDQFWTPHWRFLETDDEYFDHPAQMLSPLGAPLQGRWRIYGVFLPDQVLRKIYYKNALKYLPAVRESIERELAARSTG